MKLFVLLLFLCFNLIAQSNYSLRFAYGRLSTKNLGQIIFGNEQNYSPKLNVVSLDGGYLLKSKLFDLPVDLYLKSGISHFDEAGLKGDAYEFTLYLKVYYNLDYFDNRMRFGFGEGGSYTTSLLYYEKTDANDRHDHNSQGLNYLDISLDVDIGRLFKMELLKGTYIGWALKHRSGVFGLIRNVKHGGSNYNTVYVEKTF